MADPNQHYDLIRRPLLTEKSSYLQGRHNQYTFRVAEGANKVQVRQAIEAIFKVKVEKVAMIRQPSKIRRVLGRPSRSRPWKKAVVTLRAGDTIEAT